MGHWDIRYTEIYLHAKSAHIPAQKQVVLMTLVRRARTLCDTESLEGEIHHLKCIFCGTDVIRIISGELYVGNSIQN
jgi:hypothetical protein